MSDPTPQPRFSRGAKPSPRHALLAAVPHVAVEAPPPQFAIVPPKLSYWDNERDGVCVSSEEAYAKACWSVYCGLPELFASEAEVRDFAARHGWLNGATLTEVLDVMIREGISIAGQNYKNGSYAGVNYADETTLKSALSAGPVKIGIDANALPQGAGNHQGWYAVSGGHYPNTDHCVGLSGYGTAEFLYGQMSKAFGQAVPLPSGLSPTAEGYLLFTWSTVGFVSHQWLLSTCTEAWVRTPTTVGQVPNPPSPPNPPTPPAPLVATGTITGTVGGVFSDHKLSGTVILNIPHEAKLGFNWLNLLAIGKDVFALIQAVQAKDWAKVESEVAKLAADLGISL